MTFETAAAPSTVITSVIRCFDFETTGIPEPSPAPKHAVCEVGWTDITVTAMGFILLGETVSHFVNPGRPMPVVARAIHHISDRDVENAISQTEALRLLMTGATFFVSHRTAFEREFFGGGSIPWGCTYKAALRKYPDAPGHKNQELRYHLGLDDMPDWEPARAMPPHRAGPDSYTTAFICREMIRSGVTLADLNVWEREPALLPICYMKKHRNTPWRQVPKDYLNWILTKSDINDPDILHTARYYMRQPSP